MKRTHVRFEGRAGCQPLSERMFVLKDVLVASHEVLFEEHFKSETCKKYEANLTFVLHF